MKGSILENGVISGEDGNRYTYEESQIKNLADLVGNLVGKKVDFIAENGVATQIYIEKSTLDIIQSDDLGSIKLKSYSAIGTGILGALPYIGFIFSIASVVFRILATISVRNQSKSETILFNIVFSMVSGLIAGILILIGFVMIAGGAFLGIIGALLIILGITVIICGIISLYLYYKELTEITGQKHFKNSFMCLVAGFILIFVVVGFIFLIAAIILEILGWKNTQTISQPTGDYSKVKSIFNLVKEKAKK